MSYTVLLLSVKLHSFCLSKVINNEALFQYTLIFANSIVTFEAFVDEICADKTIETVDTNLS